MSAAGEPRNSLLRPEYLLVYLGLAWLAGVALGRYAPQPLGLWLALSAAAAVAFILLRRARLARLALACALLAGLGAARYQAAQPPLGDPAFLATYNDREATLEGVVIDEPEVRDQDIRLRLRVDQVTLGGEAAPRTVHGLALVSLPRFPAYDYGDRLRVSGLLETPPVFEEFSYREALARQGVYSLLRFGAAKRLAERACSRFDGLACNPLLQALFDFKAAALRTLAAIFPEPQASLLSGILLGVEAGIPSGLQQAFQTTGTTHIIAISGFNVSIVAGVFIFLSERLARRRLTWLPLAGLAVYTVLVGAQASVVRAAILAGLALLARLAGRQVYAPGALFGAAFAMTLVNPHVLWDVGFQLSYAATFGLVLYADPITHALVRGLARFTTLAAHPRAPALVGEYFSLTLAAQITTLPLIIYYFHRLSLVSFLVNLLILPAQPAVMIFGGLAMLAGVVWLPLGTFLGWLAWPFVTYTIALVEAFARLPGAALDLGRFSAGVVIAAYGLLFGLTWLASGKPEERPGWLKALGQARPSNVVLGALALGAALTWSAALARPDQRLHVTLLDVGQGEAALVQTPSGEYVLLGGGESAVRLGEGLGRWMPFWQRRLALVVVPGPRDSDVTGLAAELPRYTVQQVLLAGRAGRSAAYHELVEGLNRRSVPILSAEAGQEFDLGDEAKLRVLSVNAAGVIVRLTWGNASFLLPLGESAADLAGLQAAGQSLASSVLLVPENGGAGAIDKRVAGAVRPWAAVISVGVEGPAPETLDALHSYTVLRTDRNGWVSFATDGAQLWAEKER